MCGILEDESVLHADLPKLPPRGLHCRRLQFVEPVVFDHASEPGVELLTLLIGLLINCK